MIYNINFGFLDLSRQLLTKSKSSMFYSHFLLIISGLMTVYLFWVEFCTGKDTMVSEPFTEEAVFFSNVFLAPLLRGCSCQASSWILGFILYLYRFMYLVLFFCYYASYSGLKSGIVVPTVLFFLHFFSFWDYFSSFGKKILILWWRLNCVYEFNNTKLSNTWTWEAFAVFVL